MDEKKIIGALQKTWDYIGEDVLIVSPGRKVDRDVVIETTMDRVDMFHRDVSIALEKMTWEEKRKLGKKAFPSKWYVY